MNKLCVCVVCVEATCLLFLWNISQSGLDPVIFSSALSHAVAEIQNFMSLFRWTQTKQPQVFLKAASSNLRIGLVLFDASVSTT